MSILNVTDAMEAISRNVMLVLLVVVLCFALLLFRRRRSFPFCTSKKRLDGKTTLVTGSTSGIGYEIAKDFAERGARVIISCPFEDEGASARKTLVHATGHKNIVFKQLDLGSFKSVRKFAADIIETEDRLDILVNNAGIGAINDYTTKDGLNVILQVNYFGHFLLTILLLPILKKSGTATEPARVLNNGSRLHLLGTIKDMSLSVGDNGLIKKQYIYGTSKLCLALFTRELTRRLESSNIYSVVTCVVDPGAVGTNLLLNGSLVAGTIVKYFYKIFFYSPWYGAQTAITVALHPQPQDIKGTYFIHCKTRRYSRKVRDDSFAKLAWDESVNLVHVSDIELNKSGLLSK